MKKIIDIQKFNSLRIINVFNETHTFMGFYRVYWNSSSNPDTFCQVEICEINPQTFLLNETRYFKGYNELQSVLGETIFNIPITSENCIDIKDFITQNSKYTTITLL